ncbi:transcription initiation factor TFIID subunit 5-like [Humulus lupulus]|uniref:transcription initiation factor TFIID subunit 5-like n=1 Tax=Humulus lupulus TaxID=3486 RepID=UPI002B406B73|nr:transcription initiation factor TFIID subunit 5-like [Humulus lupulus]XP_062099261.1 transcription initiation factor TFIID subunit 5-like [Humulus lupulus]
MLNINSCVQKRSAGGGKQGSSVKKLKKDKVTGATGKATSPKTNIVTMAPRVKPELPLPTISVEVEQSILDHSRFCNKKTDISFHEKNLDLRLDLCTKRTVTTFTDDDLESLKFLINSARC